MSCSVKKMLEVRTAGSANLMAAQRRANLWQRRFGG
ncbi:hypothetical protein JOC37_001255 [Desulfohalotomaculum tongense]|nr:hypothetical protein [Desulforadius tongensis]